MTDTTVAPTAEPVARSSASERMRRHRRRHRDGLRCLTIQLRETEISNLISKGLLKPEMRNDTGAVVEAVHLHLDRSLNEIR
jgi:hypothetical protein